MYDVSWLVDGKETVHCQFPANIGLLTFSNKIELEKSMISKLTNGCRHNNVPELPTASKSELTIVPHSSFYIRDNGFYITPRLKNQLVFKPKENAPSICELLIDDDRYQLESISNIMTSGYSPYKIMVDLKASEYGYKSSKIRVPLDCLFNLFTDEGCTPYWGVENFDGNLIKGLYIWTNVWAGYSHVLSLSISTDALSRETSVSGNLHSFVRMDNLKHLFEEYKNL